MPRLSEKGPLIKNNFPERAYTNICTGLGISGEVPIRLGAYVLPLLQLGEQYANAQTELYIAEIFSAKLSGIDRAAISGNAQIIKTYFELLSQQTGCPKTPSWLEELDPFENSRSNILDQWTRVLEQAAPERVLRFAQSRDGRDSLQYMAAHVLYMWDPVYIEQTLFITQRDEAPQSLLMVGGPAEKVFYEARQTICQNVKIDKTRMTDQKFTEIGRRPPYYALSGEPVIGNKNRFDYDILQKIADPDILRDTIYLVISLTESLTFADIDRVKKQQLSTVEEADLVAGCDRLQNIISQLES